jgi:hypothetical protein
MTIYMIKNISDKMVSFVGTKSTIYTIFNAWEMGSSV